MRDAPSIPLITALHDMGATVRAYDPVGMEQAKKMLPELTYCNDEYDCARGASALVIVTEWEQFRALDFERLKAVMTRPVLIDLRSIYRPEEMASHGFLYSSIGRPPPPNQGRRKEDGHIEMGESKSLMVEPERRSLPQSLLLAKAR
jgi:UDPglucose 6-dehydrogenase